MKNAILVPGRPDKEEMKPPMQVVDSEDRLIGHKDRKDVDFAKDIYRVAALWLTNSNNEVLIAKRVITKDRDPGKWGPAVAGTVDEGETYEVNIYKEAEEEIGLTGVHFEPGPKQRVYQPRNYFCQWYTAQLDRDADSFILQEDEVEAVKWISEAELAEDVKQNPDRYIPLMPEIIEMFIERPEG